MTLRQECLSICKSNQCGFWGSDDQGRTGCLLIQGCPRRINDHLMIGGGCLDESNPLFPATDRYNAMDASKKTKTVDANSSRSSLKNSLSPTELSQAQIDTVTIHQLSMLFERMSESGRRAAIRWAETYYKID